MRIPTGEHLVPLLNSRKFIEEDSTTRDGRPWTMTALFDLLPRMIQVGPRVFSSQQWVTRRLHLPRVV